MRTAYYIVKDHGEYYIAEHREDRKAARLVNDEPLRSVPAAKAEMEGVATSRSANATLTVRPRWATGQTDEGTFEIAADTAWID